MGIRIERKELIPLNAEYLRKLDEQVHADLVRLALHQGSKSAGLDLSKNRQFAPTPVAGFSKCVDDVVHILHYVSPRKGRIAHNAFIVKCKMKK